MDERKARSTHKPSMTKDGAVEGKRTKKQSMDGVKVRYEVTEAKGEG
jgi:hypothetical protein